MIGQKRRQMTDIANRPRAVSVGADSTSSTDSDGAVERGPVFLRHLPRPSWLCRKFWRVKCSKKDPSNIDSMASTNSTESGISSHSTPSISSASDFVQRQRHRYRRFYRSVMKRSRTTDSLDRQIMNNDQSLSEDYVTLTDDQWKRLEASMTRLLKQLDGQADDNPAFTDEECVICVTSRASLQTFPCGHKVLCNKCFVRTVQIAFQQRQLPLHCVVCRSRIVRLKQQPPPNRVVIKQQRDPPGSFYLPQAPSPLPPSGVRRPGYM